MANEYVPFSNIAVSDVVGYLRISETELDEAELSLLASILEASKSFILTYTGRTTEEADTFPEFTIAVYAICQDMYDKRTFQVDKNEESAVISSILGSRSINLL